VDMLTERAISDSSWCPALWTDKTTEGKRVKPGRDWDPLENITKALTLGVRNKYALIKNVGHKKVAVPYGPEFWIHIPSLDNKLLITVAEISLDTQNMENSVLVKRQPKYDPRTTDHLTAENHLHHLIIAHFRKWFETSQISVETHYPKARNLITTKTNATLLSEAHVWVAEIQGYYEGTVALVPRRERCYDCFWNHCPSRNVSPLIQIKQGKNHSTSSLD
jgi:hypothetical protein